MVARATSPTGILSFANLLDLSPQACFQCNRCSAGCPMLPLMELTPAQIVHKLLLGETDDVLASNAIWTCVHCETCTARCPQGVDVCGVLHAARAASWASGTVDRKHPIATYFASFVENLWLYGRSAELPLTVICKVKSEEYLRDFTLGIGMLARGRLPLLSVPRGAGLYRRIFNNVRRKEAAGA